MDKLKPAWPLLLAGALGLAAALAPAPPDAAPADPLAPDCPGPNCPAPKPLPKPQPAPSPWGDPGRPAVAGAAVTENFLAPDGVECQNPIPREFHLKNRGGSDGSGLCVFCSIQHEAVWQDVEPLKDFFRWMWSRPGGGYPEKVERMIEAISKEKGVPLPDYIQVENNDLEILKLACRSGRSPGVTYAYSPTGRYGGQRIAHMVSLVHADDRWFGILDNNYPGSVEWMSPQEFLRSYSGGQQGWAVILLNPGPPPAPRSRPVPPRETPAVNRLLPLLASLPLLAPPSAHGGWGPSGCAPSLGGFAPAPAFAAPVLPVADSAYSWKPVPGDADQRALYRGPTQLGVWRLDLGKYFALLPGDRWEPADCPTSPPDGWEAARAGGGKPAFQALPTGVERDKCCLDGAVYKVNGKVVPKEKAYEAFGAPTLADDSAFLRLTLSGDEATRKRVLADLDLDPYLRSWKDRLVIKSYPADHWAIKDLGFLAPGEGFSLMVQTPAGEVLHRQGDYEGGAAAFAGALRKVDPNRKPADDPDLRKSPDLGPLAPLWDEVKKVPAVLWLAAAGLGLYWFLNRKKA